MVYNRRWTLVVRLLLVAMISLDRTFRPKLREVMKGVAP